ncbi:MAG: twin-arginine translocase subunit TatB [Alphaproteobacteria bacterium]|nr:twin-arginine translocase subunit TatB [Alphaproteobacteria bacterium]MBV9551254.1 twin-arginine translocase subunit TatB [Alphaproteobacteria bacterium]
MFFDIGWPELMVIGVVALVVIGPKDLPAALRVAGFWLRKARTLSREFHSSVEQMMREAELHEVQNELRKATEIDLDLDLNKIGNSTTAQPRDVPDFVDTAPAPAEPEPAMVGFGTTDGAAEPAPSVTPEPAPAHETEPTSP